MRSVGAFTLLWRGLHDVIVKNSDSRVRWQDSKTSGASYLHSQSQFPTSVSIYFCMTNCLKMELLKTANMYYLTVSVGQESEVA